MKNAFKKVENITASSEGDAHVCTCVNRVTVTIDCDHNKCVLAFKDWLGKKKIMVK